jgi:hypothetical protein
VFLDSDNLPDLRGLLQHVKDSDVVLLVLTTRCLERPWVLLEVYTALTNDIPLITVECKGGPFPYKHNTGRQFLRELETRLEAANPGAREQVRNTPLIDRNRPKTKYLNCPSDVGMQIEALGYDVNEVGRVLYDEVTNCVSKEYDPAAPQKVFDEQIEWLVSAMNQAHDDQLTQALLQEHEEEMRRIEKHAHRKKSMGGASAARLTKKRALSLTAGL